MTHPVSTDNGGSCCGSRDPQGHAAHLHGHEHRDHAPHMAPPAPQPAKPGAIYTCPMHPQIRQQGPGSCPICGMALEPLVPGAEEDDSELRIVQRKFWIAAALALPVVLVAMLPHFLDFHFADATARALRLFEVAVSAPVVLWAGADYYRRGWNGVLNRSPNMYTLIGLGVLVAWLFSLFANFAPAIFPPQM